MHFTASSIYRQHKDSIFQKKLLFHFSWQIKNYLQVVLGLIESSFKFSIGGIMGEKCVLVIDDEADIREIAKISLQVTKGWQVILAASGKQGISMAQAYQPDVILLDVTMPDMNGLDTLNQLNKNPQTQMIPVILLTAKVQVNKPGLYVETGAKAVLTKPFDPGLLGEHVEKALGWKYGESQPE
ncbi:MAG: response regulator [Almyronema sp.]